MVGIMGSLVDDTALISLCDDSEMSCNKEVDKLKFFASAPLN